MTDNSNRLSSDAAARSELVINTLSGTLRDLSPQVAWIADAADQQLAARSELSNIVDEAYDSGDQGLGLAGSSASHDEKGRTFVTNRGELGPVEAALCDRCAVRRLVVSGDTRDI